MAQQHVTDMSASLFVTCLNDTLLPSVGQAVVTVLEQLGVTVDFPPGQTCCGQMHFNTGYARESIPMVRRFVSAFGASEVIVSPSASCVGFVRESYVELARRSGDARLVRQVEALVPRTFEFCEFLVDHVGVVDVGASFSHRVTYHPTCHSLRALRLGDRPLQLLSAVRDLELVDLPGAEECCGFGGTFAIKNAETSISMMSDKLRAVRDTRAEVVATVDSSCAMQIGGGLRRQWSGVKAMHIAEILASREDAPSRAHQGTGLRRQP